MLELVVRLVLGGAVLVAALLAMRWAQARGMTARGGPQLRIVGRTGLTRTTLVAVVAVDDRRFLVGAGDHGVQLLEELDPLDTPHGEDDLDLPLDDVDLDTDDVTTSSTVLPFPLGAHGSGTATTTGPRIGPLDRLRAMTVRTHLREPIRAHHPHR